MVDLGREVRFHGSKGKGRDNLKLCQKESNSEKFSNVKLETGWVRELCMTVPVCIRTLTVYVKRLRSEMRLKEVVNHGS